MYIVYEVAALKVGLYCTMATIGPIYSVWQSSSQRNEDFYWYYDALKQSAGQISGI